MLLHHLLVLWASTSSAHAWTAAHSPPAWTAAHSLPARSLRAACPVVAAAEDVHVPAAATGEDVEKTDGIPNYMIRTSGTVVRVVGGEGSTVDADGGVVADGLLSILTSDVIDMVQQQGGAAEKLDCLGEDMLVDGLLFDDFKAGDTFEIASPDGADDALTLEIIEPRPSSALELDQLGDDESTKRGIASILSLGPGFSGWSARVVTAGRVAVGYQIAKQPQEEQEGEA